MKALSIYPPYAMAIGVGDKKIECRSWQTSYRGQLVICSTAKKVKGTVPGHALAVVDLFDIVPFKKIHLDGALMKKSEYKPGMYAWILKNPHWIVPVPVKGKLGIWDYDGKIEVIPDPKNNEEDEANFEKYWSDIIV